MTLPTDFQHLPATAREVLAEAWETAAQRGWHPAHHITETAYVAVTGGAEHPIAAHVHAHEFSITLAAADAEQACRSRPLLRLEETNPTTRHVHVSYADVGSERPTVLALMIQAIERSWRAGPRAHAARTAAHASAPAAVCPSCHMTLPATGVCDDCR